MTREEKIRKVIDSVLWTRIASEDNKNILTKAIIKALEQESILDKIRAELETIISKNHPDWIITDLVPIDEVLEVIDKYRTESENKKWKKK